MSLKENDKILEDLKESYEERFEKIGVSFDEFALVLRLSDKSIQDVIDITEDYLKVMEIEKEKRL